MDLAALPLFSFLSSSLGKAAATTNDDDAAAKEAGGGGGEWSESANGQPARKAQRGPFLA